MLPLEYPLFLLLIPLGWWAMKKLVRQKSRLGISSANLVRGVGVKIPLLTIERGLLLIFIIAVALILARPTQMVKKTIPVYEEARDIVLALDVSGSMSGDKIKAARTVGEKFITGRPGDRVGLVSFDTKARLEWPLSFDHEALIFRLKTVKVEGSTAIASGLIAGLKHLGEFGENPGAIILVSDGSSTVTDEEKTAIEFSLGETRLYWVMIVKPGEAKDETAIEFGRYLAGIGGTSYSGGVEDLPEIFGQINALETASVLFEERIESVYNFGLLPYLAMMALILAGIVEISREV